MQERQESNITISESGSYQLNLSNELNDAQNQTIVMGLYGLIVFSLLMATYLFFTQEPIVHSGVQVDSLQEAINETLDSDINLDVNDSSLEEQTLVQPKVLSEGSRTLESEVIAELPVKQTDLESNSQAQIQNKNERSENIVAALNKPVLTADSQQEVALKIEPNKLLPVLTENEKRRQRNQIKLFCAKLGEKLGSVSVEDCLQYDFIHSGILSNEKTPIIYLDYPSTKSIEEKEPIKVLLFGGIHGDEFSAISIIFKWLRFIENTDPDIDASQIYWRVVPVLNPDGLLQPDGQSKRMNANNVDLNRNFPTPDWEEDALRYWKEKTGENKRRFPGESAASEIETQWVIQQLEEFKPNAIISVHAPFGIVDADGPVEPPKKLGPLELKLLGTYPGSMGRYIGVHKNLPMLTVELERAGSMPKKDDIEHIWLDIQDWVADKVQDRDSESQAEMQSIRREDSDDNGSTVIDKKGGD